MTSEKQLVANVQNAQLSTGPTSENGKAIVSINAIKHGIFTKDLILNSDIENESETEYQELLNNLVDSLSPCNQMESLLVEKIAIDFWRLRRTIRFETGSLAKGIKKLLNDFYSHFNPNSEKIDEQIKEKQQHITWNETYLKCLEKGEVTFDKPEWVGKEIKSDIVEDFCLIAKSLKTLTKAEREMLYSYDLDFEKLRSLLIKYGYSEDKDISAKLIELTTQLNETLEKEIQKLAQQKITNAASDKFTYMLGMTLTTENTDKVLKYERSLQKSIYQNLIMLKKLQGVF